MRRTPRLLAWLAAALAAYVAVLLARYFFPPHVPRFRIETMLMWFLAAGAAAVLLRPGRDEIPPDDSARYLPYALLAVVFGVAALAIYGGALRVGFLSDDFVIADWAGRREWIHAAETGFVRPAVPMLWALLSSVPLRADVTIHLVNILLHAANALLIVSIGVGSGMRRDESAAAGALFLTFPALTEAIVWASGMQDVLTTTLALIAVAAVLRLEAAGAQAGFRRSAAPRGQQALLAIVAATVALAVKETAIVIPALALVVVCAARGAVPRGPRRTVIVVMFAIAGIYAVYRALSGVASAYGQNVGRYFAKQLLVEPFASLGEPWSAAWMQSHPMLAFSRAVLILMLVAASVFIWRRGDRAAQRAVSHAGWVLLGVLPVFTLFHVSATLEGSRYLYMPAAGFALLVAGLAGAIGRLTPLPSLAIFVIAAALAAPGVPAIRNETARWVEAARLRDTVLDAFVDLLPVSQCQSIVAEGAVDNVSGAYVLRNGFAQALAARGHASGPAGREAFRCRVTWADHLIVKQDP